MRYLVIVITAFLVTTATSQAVIYHDKKVKFEFPETIKTDDNLRLGNGSTLSKFKRHVSRDGKQHTKYHQYHEEVRVLGGTVIYHTDNTQRLYATSGHVYDVGGLDVAPGLASGEALTIAETYLLQNHLISEGHPYTEVPEIKTTTAELVIGDKLYPRKSGDYALMYVVSVSATVHHHPISRELYIDAHTGEIHIDIDNIESDQITGHGHGFYHDHLTFPVDSLAPDEYVLRDASRGDGVYVYNISDDFEELRDTDNDWSYDSDGLKASLDGYAASVKYFDFLADHFGRNSIDDQGAALTINVNRHLFVNAFWNGFEATFGNGDCFRYSPLTTFEIVSHEFTHGLTDYTSDLVYRYESGALNESMSDIFGKALEYYYDNDHFNWYIGQALARTGSTQPFRSMVDPTERFDPKLYKGQHWVIGEFDNGGVHSNSGVLNHWFYLLVEGGSGTNELGVDYSVTGIGMDEAIQIAYHMQASYLTEDSQYFDAYEYSVATARDFYGEGSEVEASVVEAWKAVGITSDNLEQNVLPFSVTYGDKEQSDVFYCLDDYVDLEIDLIYLSTETLSPGATIGGTATIIYSGEEDVVELDEIVTTSSTFTGDEFTFLVTAPFSVEPEYVIIRIDLDIKEGNKEYSFSYEKDMAISQQGEPELDLYFLEFDDSCDPESGFIVWDYYSMIVPICEELADAEIQFIYTNAAGGEAIYTEPVDGSQSTISVFSPANKASIFELGLISELDFRIDYVTPTETKTLLEEDFSYYFGDLIDEENIVTFDNKESVIEALKIDACSTCELDFGAGELVISDTKSVGTINTCIPPEEYFTARSNSFELPYTIIELCVDLTNIQNPGLVFDIWMEDTQNNSELQNMYLHMAEVYHGDIRIMAEPITTTGDEYKSFAFPLDAEDGDVITLHILSEKVLTHIDNLGIKANVISSVEEKDVEAYSVSVTNLVREEISIRSQKSLPINTRVNVYNINGELVNTTLISGRESIINVSSLATGMYILQITGEEGFGISEKVVKI